MSRKGRQIFFQKKIGVTPSVATPGDTHPSDATEQYISNRAMFPIPVSTVEAVAKPWGFSNAHS